MVDIGQASSSKSVATLLYMRTCLMSASPPQFLPETKVQYLRQNRSTCKGFCRFIELLSATTTTPNPQEALDGHLSMFAMPPTHRPEDNAAAMPPHCVGDGGHDEACDDVGPVPVGRPRGQLSDRATL